MNSAIHFHRINLLIVRYFIENKNREIVFWIIATLIFTLSIQSGSSTTLIYLTGLIFANRMFNFFSLKSAAMHYLLIPATQLEKMISAILLSTFYFFGMMMLTFALGKVISNSILDLILEKDNGIYLFLTQGQTLYSQLEMGITDLLSLFTTFATIQAIFMLGALYFKQNTIAKTMLTMVLISIGLVILQAILFKNIVGQNLLSLNYSALEYYFSNNESSETYEIISKMSSYVFILFLWIVCYFRLTEKEA